MRASSADAPRAPTRGWTGALLNRTIVLGLILIYLIGSSVNELAPVLVGPFAGPPHGINLH